MNVTSVLAQLNDLPTTFRRYGAPYTQVVDTLANTLALYTNGVDSTVAQLTYSVATDGWLDVWGLIFDAPRNINEGDIPYRLRVSNTVLAWVGTLPALQVWLGLFAPGGTIAEASPGPGCAITLSAAMTTAQITAFLSTLARIRPAGVPFTVNAVSAGAFLGTLDFLGVGMLPGAYLSSGTSPVTLPFGASTNNAVPTLPGLYFVDPTLNPAGA